MAVLERPRQDNVWNHFRPVAGFHYLVRAGKRFKDRRQYTILIIDAPQKALEMGIKYAYREGSNAFRQSQYYEPFLQSAFYQTPVWVWDQTLSKTCDVILAYPQFSESAILRFDQKLQSYPDNRVCQWSHRQIERYQRCGDLEFVDGVAKTVESLSRKVAQVDPSEFSSTLILIMQDVQDIIVPAQFAIQKRQKLYQKIEEAPQKITYVTHGTPEKKLTATFMNRHSRAIVHKTSEKIIPEEAWRGKLTQGKETLRLICISTEASTVHTLFPAAVNHAAPKVGWFVGRHAIRWYLCNLTGLVIAGAVQYGQQLAGYEEDELFSHEAIVATHWYAKWMLWTLMLNLELRQWKEDRARVQESLGDATAGSIHTVLAGMRGEVVQEAERREENGFLKKVVAHVLPSVLEGVPRSEIVHEPPPETIWRRGWNAVVEAVKSCWRGRLNHPHQD